MSDSLSFPSLDSLCGANREDATPGRQDSPLISMERISFPDAVQHLKNQVEVNTRLKDQLKVSETTMDVIKRSNEEYKLEIEQLKRDLEERGIQPEEFDALKRENLKLTQELEECQLSSGFTTVNLQTDNQGELLETLQKMSKEFDEAKETIETLKKEKNQLITANAMQSRIKNDTEAVTVDVDKCNHCEDVKLKANQQIHTLQNNLATREGQLRVLQERVIQAEEQLSFNKEQYKMLQSRYSKASDELLMVRKDKDTYAEQCAQFYEKIRILEGEGNPTIDFDSQQTSEVLFSINTEKEKLARTKQDALVICSDEQQDYQREIASLKETIADLEAKESDLKVKVELMKAENNESNMTAMELGQKTIKLEAHLKDKESKIKELEGCREANEREIEELKTRLITTEGLTSDAEANKELIQIRKEKFLLDKQLEELMNDYHELLEKNYESQTLAKNYNTSTARIQLLEKLLSDKEKLCIDNESIIEQMQAELDKIPILEEQARFYEQDFLEEKKSRESQISIYEDFQRQYSLMVTEKHRLENELSEITIRQLQSYPDGAGNESKTFVLRINEQVETLQKRNQELEKHNTELLLKSLTGRPDSSVKRDEKEKLREIGMISRLNDEVNMLREKNKELENRLALLNRTASVDEQISDQTAIAQKAHLHNVRQQREHESPKRSPRVQTPTRMDYQQGIEFGNTASAFPVHYCYQCKREFDSTVDLQRHMTQCVGLNQS